MRIFEILVSLLLALHLVWIRPRPLVIQLTPALALFFVFIHLLIEGYRWQMIPLYALIVILSALIFFKLELHPASANATFILLVAAVALPVLLPVPQIPLPSGKYQVGTAIYEMRDSARKEIYSGKDEARRFMIQVWYPAEVKSTDIKASWMPNANIYAPAIAKSLDLPSFFLDHFALANTPAYLNAQMANAEKPLPLILFSHGWKAFNTQNTMQALELASRGYIVIAVQHTYGAFATVFPDATIAPYNPAALPEDEDAPNFEAIARKLANQWAGDLSYVVDQIQDPKSETGAFFNPHADLARIGVYGHSTGGGAAIQFCSTDARCKAVLGMDPFMRPVSEAVLTRGVSQPSFFMFSQDWADDKHSENNKLFRKFLLHAARNLGVIKIMGTKHIDLSDLAAILPNSPQLGLKGPLNGKRVIEITNAYLLDFFELTVKNIPSKLFGNSSPYTEVKSLK